MPYADPEDRRAAQRRSYRKRYWQVRGMREKEAKRKSEWFAQDHVREHAKLKQRVRRLKAKRDELAMLVARAEEILGRKVQKSV